MLSVEAVPFLLSKAATAAMSAPESVTEKLVALVTSTLPVVESVRVAPP